jgi:endonuclease/exonuclease/phosphatase family metal-dependent hydrolase
VILLGDFNAPPQSRAYRRITTRYRDAQKLPHRPSPKATFPARLPMLRLDHVFVSRTIEVVRVEIVRTPLARVASDHLPLLVEIRMGRAKGPGPDARHPHETHTM